MSLIPRAGDERWKNLATLPSTNFKMVSGSLLTWLTASVYLWLVLRGDDAKINGTAWDTWLLFLGAALGLNVGQFIGKRLTYAAPSPDSERAGVPATPAPSLPTDAAAAPPAAPSAPAPANPVQWKDGTDTGAI